MELERFYQAKQPEIAALEQGNGKGLELWPHSRSSFRDALTRKADSMDPLAVIAEFKQASPSRGIICESLQPEDAALQYMDNGASAVSVLTEQQYFRGDISYLYRIASMMEQNGRSIPLLRKDFLFHPLQVEATLATPASAMLLIVRLTPDVRILRDLREQGERGGIDAVVEVFDERDLCLARESGARIIQVNARDLETLKVDRTACLQLIQKFPPEGEEQWIAASGMGTHADLCAAAEAGYHAALVGSALMQNGTPGISLQHLLRGE